MGGVYIRDSIPGAMGSYVRGIKGLCNPRSPGTHIVGPWVIDSKKKLYRDLRTGTEYKP